MKLRSQLLAFGIFSLASTLSGIAAEDRILHVELRISKALEIDPNTRFTFGYDDGMQAAGMADLTQKEDGGFRLLDFSYNLHSKNHRTALIVYHRKPSKESDQVFVLSVPAHLKPTDWTDWQQPNFYETNAPSNFRFKYVPADRSTNAPLNAFSLRYKIE